MMVSEMSKRQRFFVNVGIAVKSVGLFQVQGNVPRVEPMGHFTFWARGMPRNAPQVWVYERPEMPHRLWVGIIVARQTDRRDVKAMLFPSPAREYDTM